MLMMRADMEAMFTMVPGLFCAIITLAAACAHRKVPKRFTSITRFQSSGRTDSTGKKFTIPTCLRHHIGHLGNLLRVGNIAVERGDMPSILFRKSLCYSLCLFHIDIYNGEFGAGLDKGFRNSLADTSGAAGHEGGGKLFAHVSHLDAVFSCL